MENGIKTPQKSKTFCEILNDSKKALLNKIKERDTKVSLSLNEKYPSWDSKQSYLYV